MRFMNTVVTRNDDEVDDFHCNMVRTDFRSDSLTWKEGSASKRVTRRGRRVVRRGIYLCICISRYIMTINCVTYPLVPSSIREAHCDCFSIVIWTS
jgi:hypothetical protein